MGHIHEEPGQHDQTSSAFIIRLDTAEPTLMLHMHRKLGMYLQFGGHVELVENPWAAIAHELTEEAGYDLSDLKILQPVKRIKYLSDAVLHPESVCTNTHVFREGHFHTDVEYAFTATGPPNRSVAEGESTQIELFTRAELKALDKSVVYDNIKQIGEFIFDVCLSEWEQVDTSEFSLR
jgi:8-oxo-dGTP pyrophosphatase MutT (NUDIX family)